jgi:micrococcal nuclease
MKPFGKIVLLIIVIVVLIGISLLSTNITGEAVAKEGPFIVTKVIDGDTVVLDNGEHVRMSGINTPEVGECYYAEAKNMTTGLLLNKEVVLESDRTNRDVYDRLLRYIYVDNVSVSFYLVDHGYAKVYDKYKDDTKYYEQLKAVEQKAVDSGVGVWACNNTACPYVGSKNSDKYYAVGCKYAKRIHIENQICFNTTQQAEQAGYVAGSC